MKRIPLWVMAFLVLAVSAHAQSFYLVDRESQVTYGPFDFKQGAPIAIGKQVFILKKPIVDADAKGLAVEARMQAIKIPSIELRTARIEDAVDFLRKAAADNDDPRIPENQRGINLILNLQGQDPKNIALITFPARNISFIDALKAITSTANLRYRVEGSVVFIEPKPPVEKKPQK
jgi:hypothetical protein